MTTHKGFATLPLLIIGLIIVLGGGAAWWAQMQSAPQATTTPSVQLPIAKEVPKEQSTTHEMQLSTDLVDIVPQFVDNNPSFPLTLKTKIEQDIQALFPPNEDNKDWVHLIATGKRYIFYGASRIEWMNVVVMDVMTEKSTNIDYGDYFLNGKSMVFISEQDICTYTPDTPACVPVPGAKLSGNEVYGFGGMGGLFDPVETHTGTSITITTFVPDPDPKALQNSDHPVKKSRVLTLALLQPAASNIFTYQSKPGDKVGGMVLATINPHISPSVSWVEARFTGTVSVTGTLEAPVEGAPSEGIGPAYFLKLTSDSLGDLPRLEGEPAGRGFGFKNLDVVKAAPVKNGDLVQVVISGFNYTNRPSEVWNTAEVVSIKKVQ